MTVTFKQRLRELQPDGVDKLEAMNAAAWAATDPELLELCRLRIAGMLGGQDSLWETPEVFISAERRTAVNDWHSTSLFSPREQAHLAFTEQFVIAVGSVTNEDVAELLKHQGEREVYEFISALYTVELTYRMSTVLASTFLATEVSS